MQLTRPVRQLGIGLIDGLIAIVILCVGMLAMVSFQGRLIAQSTDSQRRLLAMQASDELLGTVLADSANAGCYTLPQLGSCASDAAKNAAQAWKTRSAEALPGGESLVSLDAGQVTVTITWRGQDLLETHTLEATTDVRQ